MRSSRVVRASDCQCQSRTVLGLILASSDTVESGAADETVLNEERKNPQKIPLKKIYKNILHASRLYTVYMTETSILYLDRCIQQCTVH
jgi:hypothetical protein